MRNRAVPAILLHYKGLSPLRGFLLAVMCLFPNLALPQAFQQGFDFRNTSTFAIDSAGGTYVLSTTAYPTKGSGVTYGWVKTSLVNARDRNAQLDPRLAGINYATNGSPATFYVDLPWAGTY